jgi:5-methyltetrahydrofolate--homocysteine methyltransferase
MSETTIGYRAVTFDDLRIAYKQQVEALMDGGCDFCRNYFDTLKCQKRFAIEEVKDERNLDVPIMVQERLPMLLEEHFRDKR